MSAVQQQPPHHHHHHHQSHHYQQAMSSQPQTPASPGTVQRSQSTRTPHVRQSSLSRTATTTGRPDSYHQHSSRRDPDQHSTRMQPPPASYERRPDHNRQPSNMSDAPSPMVGTPGSTEEPGRSSQKPRKTTLQGVTGTWILGKTIGAGSMGKVKIARKSDGSEQCAVKIVPRGGTEKDHSSRAPRDESKEIRTAREAAIMTLLNHPYICGMRDVVRTNNHWYMMLEYVNGGQMLDYIISHGRLKEKQARKFGRQIASALDYCHRNSIVHRDLKIENILISKTGDIKIIDFGLSNLYSPRSLLGTFCGSLYFAAPELLQAKPYLGPEVDVWSFGIVLYVLVCGKVPFDDQSMPALHAKIKRGLVDYPAWLSQDCKSLLSRMLVTDPRQRATLMEIMHHPWMNKGFDGPPKNYLPHREPLTLPLDPNVIMAMTGFEFGTPETIQNLMTRVIESDEYQQAARLAMKENAATPSVQEKKKGFQFDFYKRRSSTSSRDALSAPSAEALSHPYTDPLSAFHPLLSVYYLVREKQERDRTLELSTVEANTAQALAGNSTTAQETSEKAPQLPIIPIPEMAHTNDAGYDGRGDGASPSKTRPRARTHGDEDIVEGVNKINVSNQTTASTQSSTAPDSIKKESTAASLLRRFSTRRHSQKPENKATPTPVVTVQGSGASPAASDLAVPRKSLSVRRARDSEMGGSQPNQPQFLSPDAAQFDSASSSSSKKGTKLSRSTSVSEADHRRKNSLAPPKTSESQTPHLTSKGFERPLSLSGRPGSAGKVTASRANSTGHSRRESYSFRRVRREEPSTVPVDVPEETDADMASAGSTEAVGATPSIDHVKPIFLKGLLSVSTTTSKPPAAIRADLMRVLREMGVEYREIKGGFSCTHRPSIDLATVQDNVPQSPEMASTQPSSHRRKLSFGGAGAISSPMKRRNKSEHTNDLSGESMNDPSTQIQSELGGSMILQFDIFIVKVPLMNLYGIQQKKIAGNSWSYKNMITKIISELRL
ncbi:serine/threonine-protein kinase KIN2 [Orbilia ellipsospora]|uniref:non-specific serine/threonine protein kinase n=1 Tax=Orbilia ellipsospora TaxID=2528407 RepID=A0AAV9XK83_9PEZI